MDNFEQGGKRADVGVPTADVEICAGCETTVVDEDCCDVVEQFEREDWYILQESIDQQSSSFLRVFCRDSHTGRAVGSDT